MNVDEVATLTEAAATAVPTWSPRKRGPVGKWTLLFPAYAKLRGQGFTIRESVDWLIERGAVNEVDRKKAEYGLPMVHSRRRREASRAVAKA